jgi:hypothetical protein
MTLHLDLRSFPDRTVDVDRHVEIGRGLRPPENDIFLFLNICFKCIFANVKKYNALARSGPEAFGHDPVLVYIMANARISK